MTSIRTLALSSLLAIAFVGCSHTSIDVKNNTLHLQNDDQMIHAKTTLLKKDFVNLSTIYINREILTLEEGDIITYEHVSIQSPYRLYNTYNRALRLIFDAKDVEKQREANTLTYFILTLKDNSKIDLIVKTSTKKNFSMVYGKNPCLFENAMKELSAHDFSYKCVKVTTSMESAVKSKWQPKLIILDGLLEMEPKMGAH